MSLENNIKIAQAIKPKIAKNPQNESKPKCDSRCKKNSGISNKPQIAYNKIQRNFMVFGLSNKSNSSFIVLSQPFSWKRQFCKITKNIGIKKQSN